MNQTDGSCLGKIKTSSDATQTEEDSLKNQSTSECNAMFKNNEAPAPVIRDSDYYNMNHKQRGLLLIFNHENFDKHTKQDKRNGSDKDVTKIYGAFKDIGFEVHVFKDLTLTEIQQHIGSYASQTTYNYNRDCLAIFILTHGEKDLLWAKDDFYDPSVEIWGKFGSDNCPSLAVLTLLLIQRRKPKLFFLQACQGSKFDQGIKLVHPRSTRQNTTEFDGHIYYEYPVYADFLIFYATFEGFYAFRNNQDGSYWVTVLCEELLRGYEKQEIQQILTKVNRRLSLEFKSSSTKQHVTDKKQISYYKSSLTRSLIFGKK